MQMTTMPLINQYHYSELKWNVDLPQQSMYMLKLFPMLHRCNKKLLGNSPVKYVI